MPPLDALHMKRIFAEDLDTELVARYLDNYIGYTLADQDYTEEQLKEAVERLSKSTERLEDLTVLDKAIRAGQLTPEQTEKIEAYNSEHEEELARVSHGDYTPGTTARRIEAKPAPDPQRIFQGQDGHALAAGLRRMCQVSETFYVSPDMLHLAMQVQHTMPDEDIHPEDLPTPAGFMYLPSGLGMIDIRGRPSIIHAVVWSVQGGRVFIYLFTDRRDARDAATLTLRIDYGDDLFSRLPFLNLQLANAAEFGHPLPRTLTNAALLEHPEQLQVYRDDSEALAFYSPEGVDPDLTVQRDPLFATLLCIWRLMQQPIVDLRVEDTPHALRKQLRRAQLNAERVTVIELRRREGMPHDEHGNVDWSHRWIVRGHWRKQPCKVEGEWSHRVIWINPYLKGPEDKPLIIRDRVNALLR